MLRRLSSRAYSRGISGRSEAVVRARSLASTLGMTVVRARKSSPRVVAARHRRALELLEAFLFCAHVRRDNGLQAARREDELVGLGGLVALEAVVEDPRVVAAHHRAAAGVVLDVLGFE